MINSADISLSRATIAKLVIALTAALYFLESGCWLPYLLTAYHRTLQYYVLSPLLMAGFLYMFIFYKWPPGKTGFETARQLYPDKRGKIRFGFLLMMGTLLFGWMAARDISIGVPAWVAYYTASEPIMQVYQIQVVTERGGPGFTGRFDLGLSDPVSGDEVVLPVKRTDYPETMYARPIWRVGDTLCVRGRTSFFGTIIDKTERNTDRC
jgi:hypothetical protein